MGTILIAYGILLIVTMLVVRFRPRANGPQRATAKATPAAGTDAAPTPPAATDRRR